MANLRRAAASIAQRLANSTAAPVRFSSTSSSAASRILSQNLHRLTGCTFCWPSYRLVNRFFSISAGEEIHVDLSSEESRRRLYNRLLYRSKQRGFLELDLVLGKWVDENIHKMDEAGIRSLVDVLDIENPDLWKWLSNQDQPPEAVVKNPVFCAVHSKVIDNLNNHSAPETRAEPGNPWVRGWDDIKRARDAPLTGNQ